MLKKVYGATFWNKVILTVLFMLCTIATFAQPGSPSQGDCGDSSAGPDEPCPLDTWVIVLVIVALFFVVAHLRKKQKDTLKMQS